MHGPACIQDPVHERCAGVKRRTVHSSGTRIEQVHNHLAVHIHIQRRELGRFSLLYNQFRVTTRGGVNVVGAPGCGRLPVEWSTACIHGYKSAASFLDSGIYYVHCISPAQCLLQGIMRVHDTIGELTSGIFSVIRILYC